MNNIIIKENVYIVTMGKGLKECNVKGRFCCVKVVLLLKNKNKGGNRIK